MYDQESNLEAYTEGNHTLGIVPPRSNKTSHDVRDSESTHFECQESTINTDHIELFQCQKSVNTETGELTRANCDNARCVVCATAQRHRVARFAAWSLQDAAHIYFVTLTLVDRDEWPVQRKALLRRMRNASGGSVEMFAALEHKNGMTHAHAMVWSDQPLKTWTRAASEVKPVKRSWKDIYATCMYLTKDVETEHAQHLALNEERLLWWSKGAFKGFSGMKACRAAYQDQEGWHVGSKPDRALTDVPTVSTDEDAFAMRRTVSKPMRNGVRAAAKQGHETFLISANAQPAEPVAEQPSNKPEPPTPASLGLRQKLAKYRPPSEQENIFSSEWETDTKDNEGIRYELNFERAHT